jgi:hypothetical protein
MNPAEWSDLQCRQLERDSARWPSALTRLPLPWPPGPKFPTEAWRSRDFLLQVYAVREGVERLSINRAKVDMRTRRWVDGISWDELQRLKAECGRGHLDAVEIYPADADVVNVANVRHLFVFSEPFDLTWRTKDTP